MTEQNITEEKNIELVDNQDETIQLDVDDAVKKEVKEQEIASDVVMPNIDYLDKKILDMKTINFDELENYQSGKKIDDSIYENTVLDIKQNRIVDGTVINVTDKCIFVDIGFKSEGMISKDEFFALQKRRIEKRFAKIDLNKDNQLSKEEMIESFSHMNRRPEKK